MMTPIFFLSKNQCQKKIALMCKADKCNKKLLVGRKKQELAFFIFNITEGFLSNLSQQISTFPRSKKFLCL